MATEYTGRLIDIDEDGNERHIFPETKAEVVTFTDGKTMQEKLDSGELKGAPGNAGTSAYAAAKAAGYTGTEAEFNALMAVFGAHASRHKSGGADPLSASDVGAATTNTFSQAIDTSWTANSAGGYYKTVTVSGVLASDEPIADVVLGDDVDANALYKAAWALVDRIKTEANSITLCADGEAPANAFTVKLKVVR